MKAKPIVGIRHNDALPPVAAAANLALIILTKSSKNTWFDLIDAPDSYSHIRLSDEQQELLEAHRDILPMLCRRPLRTIYACNLCGRYAFIDATNAPARCTLTLGCVGHPVKATTQQPRI